MSTTKTNKKIVVEKILGIPPDYQYKAIRSKKYLQANWHRNKIAVIQKLLKLNKTTSILDLGPGSGNFELIFWPKVKKIVAVDYNDEAISFINQQLYRKKIKNVKTIVEDIRNLYKRKELGKFDIVLLVDVIEHVHISEAKKVISQLKNFLNKNGEVVIITPNYKSPWILIEWLLDRFTILAKLKEEHKEQHLAKFYKENLIEIFSGQGYSVDKISSFNLFSWLIPNEKVSRFLAELEVSLFVPFGNLLIGIFTYKS